MAKRSNQPTEPVVAETPAPYTHEYRKRGSAGAWKPCTEAQAQALESPAFTQGVKRFEVRSIQPIQLPKEFTTPTNGGENL